MDIFSILILFLNIWATLSIWFDVPANGKKCFQEEIHKDILVAGDYEISEVPGHTVDLQVTNTKDHIFYKKENAKKARFSFTSDEYDVFDICFYVKSSQPHDALATPIYLNLQHGVDAKNFDDLAHAEKLKPLEIEMKRLEDLSIELVKNLVDMKKREQEMRKNNESTSNRVFYFSMFGMVCLCLLASWQVLYLRRYFKSKKLIS